MMRAAYSHEPYSDSRRSSAMYSPPDSLTRFFLRSMTESVPSCVVVGVSESRRTSKGERRERERAHLVPAPDVARHEPAVVGPGLLGELVLLVCGREREASASGQGWGREEGRRDAQ